MPLLMGITLPAGIEIVYNKAIRMYDISFFCNVGKNPQFFPRSKFYTLREITYLYQIAYIWSTFSEAQKTAWATAAEVMGQHGYNLYVQDKSYRLKHGIAGEATPSIYHQFTVGHIYIPAPASQAEIVQHNNRRVNFPANFELCYKTNLTRDEHYYLMANDGHLLTEAGDELVYDSYDLMANDGVLLQETGDKLLLFTHESAKAKFTWTRYYQGQNIESVETIDLGLVQAWTHETKDITYYKGTRGKWRIEIDLENVIGEMWFDNIWAFYSSEIKLNDPFCMDVVNWWKALNLSQGATLDTIYPTGGAL